MSLVMEDFKPSVSTIDEVKKLQDLVRKLELQNLHLRNKQISNRRRSDSPVKEHRALSNSSRSVKIAANDKTIHSESNTHIDNSPYSVRDEYFDDLDIISVSDIEMSDDESWLYTSPTSFSNDRKENSYNWLRKDVDDPENRQLQLTKKALLTKLNELEILSPTTKLNSHHLGSSVNNLHRSHAYYKTPLSSKLYDPAPIDTRTFTRSRKKQALDFLEKLDLLGNERNLDKIQSVESLNRRGSDVSSDSLSTCHVLEDANDVQEVARMQEESLRMNSPMNTPKRGSLSSTCRRVSTSRGSVSDQDISETSVFSAQSADDIEQDLFESDSFQMDPLHHSNHSSSSESPYGSNVSLHDSGKGAVKLSGYRRSLPNLNREPTVLRQSKNNICKEEKVMHSKYSNHVKIQSAGKKSDSHIESSSKNHRREFISRSRQPSKQLPQHGQPSFESLPNSEPITNVPRSADSAELRRPAKSCLPRPSRASSASRSTARSGIPMPSMLNKKRVEDTWSEGCY